MEVVVTCKDGSRKNILWGYIPLGDKNYAYGLDLTARKQAEAALGAERWRLQHLFEHSPVATWLEDFTVLHQWMEQLRAQGVTDLSAFLRERPAQVAHALGLIRVLDMNLAAVVQNAAQSKQHLRGRWN
jgi:PAS domain-containing protein